MQLDNLKRYGFEVYDITPDFFKHVQYSRGYEIHTWLTQHPDVESWVVLDDEWFWDFAYYEIRQHLVETSFYIRDGGLQDAHVEKAIRILNGELNMDSMEDTRWEQTII